MLPASTLSNVGIYASGQAYEMALIRMQASPLAEVRDYGELMLTELRKVIPAFMSRVDLPDRGVKASKYLADNRAAVDAMSLDSSPQSVGEVTLVDWDPEAEVKLAAAALYSTSQQPDSQLLAAARRMTPDQVAEIIATYVGDRTNRRHKPGRAAERTYYRFDILSDYGAFRDLQRHRMLTIEWQRLGTRFGYDTPQLLSDLGLDTRWHTLMAEASELFEAVHDELGPDVAQYVVPFCFKIRYNLEMNAREAFHLLELRTQPSGHPAYRRVCQEMHRQISEVAGHHQIAAAMKYVNYETADLERLEESRRIESKRRGE
jgi:thymidylate synthase ThyX